MRFLDMVWCAVSWVAELLERRRDRASRAREAQEPFGGLWLGDGDPPREYRPEEA